MEEHDSECCDHKTAWEGMNRVYDEAVGLLKAEPRSYLGWNWVHAVVDALKRRVEMAAPTSTPLDAEPERLAKMIAWDEYGAIEHSWCNNHTSCGYGCCGGGKEVDREALQHAIVSAFRELLAASPASGAPTADEVVWRVEIFREDDGRFACEFASADRRIGGMSDYSSTPVGALAELCATLIKLDEDDSLAASGAVSVGAENEAPPSD